MPGVCNGYCPIEELGFDPQGRVYYYTAIDCTDENHPQVKVQANRPHQVGGNCSDCVDCIQAFIAKPNQAHLPKHLLGGQHLTRGAYRKGVPWPYNPFHKLYEFLPGPNAAILAEYTAEYRLGRNYLVRLFTVGSQGNTVTVFGLGWELDRASPPSPFFVPHLSRNWVRKVTRIPGGHLVEVDQIGEFRVATVK